MFVLLALTQKSENQESFEGKKKKWTLYDKAVRPCGNEQ